MWRHELEGHEREGEMECGEERRGETRYSNGGGGRESAGMEGGLSLCMLGSSPSW